MATHSEETGLDELSSRGPLGAGVAIDLEDVVPPRAVRDDGGGGPRRVAAAGFGGRHGKTGEQGNGGFLPRHGSITGV